MRGDASGPPQEGLNLQAAVAEMLAGFPALLASHCKQLGGAFSPVIMQHWEALLELLQSDSSMALHLRQSCGLQGIVHALLVVFDEAVTALTGPSRPASASAALSGSEQAMLDDDLDLMPQAAPRQSASLPAAAAFRPGLDRQLIAAGALEAWQSACEALGSGKAGSMLRPRKYNNASLAFVLGRFTMLAKGLKQGSLAQEDRGAAGNLLLELWHEIVDKFGEGREVVDESWRVRRQLTLAVSELLHASISIQPTDVETCSQWLQDVITDDSFRVRALAIEVIAGMSDVWPEDEFTKLSVSAALVAPGIPQGTPLEKYESYIMMFGGLAIGKPHVERDAVYLLACHAAGYSDHFRLVQCTVELLSASNGYPCVMDYFEFHKLPFLCDWATNACSLQDLLAVQDVLMPSPSQNGKPSKHHILYSCRHELVAFYLIRQKASAIQELAQLLGGESLPELLKQSFATVAAAAFPYHDTQVPEDKQIAQDLFSSGPLIDNLGSDEIEQLINDKQTLVSILGKMVLLCDRGANPSKPFFTSLVVRSAMESFTSSANAATRHESLWTSVNEYGIVRLLVMVHFRLLSAHCGSHRLMAFAPFEFLVKLLEGRVLHPAIFQYTTQILLNLLQYRDMQVSGCALLSAILSRAFGAGAAVLAELLPFLQPILTSVINSFEVSASAAPQQQSRTSGPQLSEEAGLKALADIIDQLTLQAPEEMEDQLFNVEPPPPHALVQESRDKLLLVRSTLTALERLRQLVGSASTMPAALRQRSIASLAAMVGTDWGRLLSQSEKSGVTADGVSEGCSSAEVHLAAWRLASIASQLGDDAMSVFAGALLAEVGPVSASSITVAAKGHPLGQPIAAQRSRAGARRKADDSTLAMLSAVLPKLAIYLISEDAGLITATQTCLQRLLLLPDAVQALEQLDKPTRDCLAVFKQGERAMQSEDRQRTPSAKDWQDLEREAIWKPEDMHYGKWICQLAVALLRCAGSRTLHELKRVAAWKPDLAEMLLPWAFLALAGGGISASTFDAITAHVEKHIFKGGHPKVLRAVRLLLTVLEFLRSKHLDGFMNCKAQDKTNYSSFFHWERVYWLDLEYHIAAAAALKCGQPLTALLYMEHGSRSYDPRSADFPQLLDEGPLPEEHQMLLDIYSQTTEPDGIYAIAYSHRLASQMHLFCHEGAWSKALLASDLMARAHLGTAGGPGIDTVASQGITRALQHLGCMHTARAYSSHSAGAHDAQCETAWRMGQWPSLPETRSVQSQEGPGFHAAVCGFLQALEKGDREICSSLLQVNRAGIVQRTAAASSESTASINQALVQLQMLAMLQEAWEVRWKGRLSLIPGTDADSQAQEQHATASPGIDAIAERWSSQSESFGRGERFEMQEPLLRLQHVIMWSLNNVSGAAQALQQTARAARKAGQLMQSMAAIHELHAMLHRLDADAALRQGQQAAAWQSLQAPDAKWRLEEAKLLWTQGQTNMALRLLDAMIEHVTPGCCPEEYEAQPDSRAGLMTLQGKWMAHTRSKSPEHIMRTHQEAMDLLMPEDLVDPVQGPVPCRTAYRFARYADGLYGSIKTQRASPEHQIARAIVKAKQEKLAENQQRQEELRANKRPGAAAAAAANQQWQWLQRQNNDLRGTIAIDSEEQRRLDSDSEKYLQIAVNNYRRCLMFDGLYDLPVVFRLCQLWFDDSRHASILQDLSLIFQDAPSHKFLCLVYQMASRLTAEHTGKEHQIVLRKLLERLAKDHPYHTLCQLLALAHGDVNKVGKRSSGSMNADPDKVAAAQAVLQQVAQHPNRTELVTQMTTLVDFYIELAVVPPPADTNKMAMPFPAALRRRLPTLPLVPVISSDVPIDPAAQYDNITHFAGFGETIRFAGGINRPKIVKCRDSAGREHRQLVKSGTDDLRQDAVMQQIFSIANIFLQASAPTCKRNLTINNYKVVPFSPFAGLLQWVEDTTPIMEWLVGAPGRSEGAHQRYAQPGDWQHVQCQNHMREQPASELLQRFKQACSHFHPCLRQFFLEEWRTPAEWFEHRLAYIRSTAANSMVGYIMGLGDRHLNNILINRRTAEVVHIDLGIAFEQGRLLNTPELVPFRLTREIVDGFGSTGTNGVMERCCVETLSVLRSHTEDLLTIIQVFIHDPLWKMVPSATTLNQKQQQGLAGEDAAGAEVAGEADRSHVPLKNVDAERVLLRCRLKLEGREGGQGEARGLEGQVQQLFNDAQDPNLLCKMFAGWAPWL
ncbi:hypothetical protein WJX73_002395 [Symbiochloris irregularis]|uniref:non-specific serine/threonine protein kinase n=1 Tax=Symbiochloris irregularis TaxID=706552 RepID=A0AAW1Q257_9CHLO